MYVRVYVRCMGCVSMYACEWCVCQPTHVSKKMSVDRSLGQALQRTAGSTPVAFQYARRFANVWTKGQKNRTLAKLSVNFAQGMDLN